MSSFIVSDQTLGQILFQFLNPHRNDCDLDHDVCELAKSLGRNLCQPSDEDPIWDDLPIAMQELNNRAVNERYSTENSVMTAANPYPATMVQSYKSLRCFLYQCNEGNIPETSELYKALERMSGRWADEIVSSLPEYEKAPWDA